MTYNVPVHCKYRWYINRQHYDEVVFNWEEGRGGIPEFNDIRFELFVIKRNKFEFKIVTNCA